MRFNSICALAVLVGSVVTSPVPDTHVLHEKRDVGAEKWLKRRRLDADHRLPMRVGLKQSNLEKGHDWLMDLSHPESEKYGKFWTAEQVTEAFKPSQETVNTVRDWLVHLGGIHPGRITHSENRVWLAFDATAQEAESLLHTVFHEYEHSSTGHLVAGSDEYHVPKAVQAHIDYITPGVKGSNMGMTPDGLLRKRAHGAKSLKGQQPKSRPAPYMPERKTSLETCDVAITPACLRALYHFDAPSPYAKVNPNNSLGIFEEGDFYSQKDLDLFFTNFTSYIPNGTHPILDSVDGGEAPVATKNAGGESDLDFELAYPIIYPQTITLYQVDDLFYAEGGNGTTDGIFNTFFDAIDGSYCTYCAYGECGDSPTLDPTYPDPTPGGFKGQLECGIYKPTNVISISYGEQEQDLPAYYQERQCNEFLKLGLQGTSIFVASGDTGVGGLRGDGSANGCLRNGTVFSPTQPNSCPYLTNVGATKVYPGKTVFEPESAVNDPAGQPYRSAFSSGGGFSNIFPIPKYQQKAVATYFERHNPPYPYYFNGQYNNSDGLYNRNGRGIPDVAANGDNIAVYNRGNFTLEGGTSASSPIFASLINRIVEERLARGKGPIGFINPVLYENPHVLNDITNGSNPGCGTNGFSSVKGWDPVTGLGTPNYPKLLKLFLSLP